MDRHPTPSGFTVIELMITIAVLAIVFSLALPSYRAIIEKRQVTSGAEQATAFFSTVKSIAVKRNEDIGLYIDPNAGCLGFRVIDGASCDCSLDVPDAGLTLAELAGSDYCAVDADNDGAIVLGEQTTMRADELRKPEVIQDITFYSGGAAAYTDIVDDFDNDPHELAISVTSSGVTVLLDGETRIDELVIDLSASAATDALGRSWVGLIAATESMGFYWSVSAFQFKANCQEVSCTDASGCRGAGTCQLPETSTSTCETLNWDASAAGTDAVCAKSFCSISPLITLSRRPIRSAMSAVKSPPVTRALCR